MEITFKHNDLVVQINGDPKKAATLVLEILTSQPAPKNEETTLEKIPLAVATGCR